jgi:flagellar assembly factor FliW
MSPATDELSVVEQTPAELVFVAPLLGFDHLSRFALVELSEGSPLFSLQSLEDAGVRLLVIPPQAVLTDYAPTIDTVSLAAIGLVGGPDPLVLVVVNAGETLAASTVNLLAPILLNRATGAAAQVVLTGSDYPLRFPLAD